MTSRSLSLLIGPCKYRHVLDIFGHLGRNHFLSVHRWRLFTNNVFFYCAAAFPLFFYLKTLVKNVYI